MKNKRTEVQQDLIDQVPEKPHGLLQLAPRVGKSKIGISIIKREKYRSILWVTPSRKLAEEDLPKEFATWKGKAYLAKTKFTTYASLSKEVGHFDVIILDEYQDITPGNAEGLLTGTLTSNSIIGLSGTHPKHQEKLDIYKTLNLSVLAKVDIDEAVDLGLIANYQITVLEVDMDNINKNIAAGSKLKPFMTTEAAQYQYQDKVTRQAIFSRASHMSFQIMKRMRMVYNSLSKEAAGKFLLDNLKGRKLIFCGSIEQAERLCPHSYYHSKSNDVALKKFLAGETDELALVNAGGVGFTYTNVQHFIIIQADSDKKGLTTQKIARSLLEQGEDYVASIYVLKLLNTQDDSWVTAFIESYNKAKVTYQRFINFKNSFHDIQKVQQW